MRFLIDNALSPVLAHGLNAAGHEAVHVKDLGLESAPDEQLFALAAAENRVVVSADTDFGFLFAKRTGPKPSVVLFRRLSQRQRDNFICSSQISRRYSTSCAGELGD